MIRKLTRFFNETAGALKEFQARNQDLKHIQSQMPCFNQDLLLALIDKDQDYRTYQYGAPGAARVFDQSEDSTTRYSKLGQVSEPVLIGSHKNAFSRLRCSQNPTQISTDLRSRLATTNCLEFDYFDCPNIDGHTVLQHFPHGQPLSPEVYTSYFNQQILDILNWNRQLYRDLGCVLDLTPTYPRETTTFGMPFVYVPGLWVTIDNQVLVSSTTFLSNQGQPQEKVRARANMAFMTYLEAQMGQPVFN